jgi:hypothetical protein
MANEQEYSQFDRYLSGDLNPEELANFHNSLKADPAMRQELDWMESAVNEVRGMGRALMKERVNAIALLIPEMDYHPYKPSITPRTPGFFMRWWPVLAITAAVTALVTWYVVPETETPAPQPRPVPQQEQPAAPPATDSVFTSVSADTVKTVEVKVKPTPPAPGNECRSFSVIARYFLPQQKTWADGEQLGLSLCPQEKAKPNYSFSGNDLTLTAAYTDTAGLRISGTGDTLYLTDNRPGFFLLVKGKTSEPLVRRARKTINPSIGIRPDKP